MPGRGIGHGVGVRRDRADEGGRDHLRPLEQGRLVDDPQDLGRLARQAGRDSDPLPQEHHRLRRGHAAPGHVADRRHHPAFGGNEGVVPIAAQVAVVAARPVKRVQREPRPFGQFLSEKSLLKGRRDASLAVIPLGVGDGLAGAPAQFLGGAQVVVVERLGRVVVAHEGKRADDARRDRNRHDDLRAVAQRAHEAGVLGRGGLLGHGRLVEDRGEERDPGVGDQHGWVRAQRAVQVRRSQVLEDRIEQAVAMCAGADVQTVGGLVAQMDEAKVAERLDRYPATSASVSLTSSER